MTAELDVAVEEMQQLFKTAWDANSGAVFGYLPGVEWQGVEAGGKVDHSLVWVRFSTQNVFEQQATLSTCAGAPYQKRYQSSGLVFVQLFIPKSIANGLILGRKLAKVARDAFRGKKSNSGVTFLNVRINDNLAPEELFYRINVVAEYDFDAIG